MSNVGRYDYAIFGIFEKSLGGCAKKTDASSLEGATDGWGHDNADNHSSSAKNHLLFYCHRSITSIMVAAVFCTRHYSDRDRLNSCLFRGSMNGYLIRIFELGLCSPLLNQRVHGGGIQWSIYDPDSLSFVPRLFDRMHRFTNTCLPFPDFFNPAVILLRMRGQIGLHLNVLFFDGVACTSSWPWIKMRDECTIDLVFTPRDPADAALTTWRILSLLLLRVKNERTSLKLPWEHLVKLLLLLRAATFCEARMIMRSFLVKRQYWLVTY